MKCAGDASDRSWRPSASFLCAIFVVAVVAVVVGLVLTKVGAQTSEVLTGLDGRTIALPGFRPTEARRLKVNGIAVSFNTEVIEASLRDTLAYYEGLCAGGGRQDEPYGSLLSALATRSRRTENDGYVACIFMKTWGLRTLASRIGRFVRTWDLADLGSPRFVYAARADSRPAAQTFVLTMWALGSVSLRSLLPVGEKDAPGHDPPGVPRPPGSQRILSATELSEPAGVFTYSVRASTPDDIERLYRTELSSRRWHILQRGPEETIAIDGIRILSAENGERLLTVVANPTDSGGVIVTLLDWRRA